MSKDKLATILGSIAALATTAAANGVTVGHFHGLNFLSLIGGLTTAGWAWATNKQ